jgi:tetraacyldisaccharide 4'-kinase
VEFLIRRLSAEFKMAVLSRGYGRQTKGFLLAEGISSPKLLGDEPFQIYSKFKDKITVAVGEERILAIPMILAETEGTAAILLDDAYQHRYLSADLNILLTTCKRPFFKDFVLPAGRLREGRHNAIRADIIVVTKCPDDMAAKEKQTFRKEISVYSTSQVPIFFTSLKYGQLYPLNPKFATAGNTFILVTGIVDPDPIRRELEEGEKVVLETLAFPDHHFYTPGDIESIIDVYRKHAHKHAVILTTEKDAVKLKDIKLLEMLKNIPVFVLPVEITMEPNDEEQLLSTLKGMINNKNAGGEI